MTTNELRAKFEVWFSKYAADIDQRADNGDELDNTFRDFAWKGYQAAHASRDVEVEALRKRINDAPVYYVPTKKPDSEDSWRQVIGSVKALNDMRGKHVRLVIDAAM